MTDSAGSRGLCFDYGVKRMGVAVGSRMLGHATELPPLKAQNGQPDWSQVADLIVEWGPDFFVVGLPLNMDGSESELSRRASRFGRRLQGRFNKPYYMMDERLSSYEAKGEAISQFRQRNFGEHSVDGRAACLILESWFRQLPKYSENEKESQ